LFLYFVFLLFVFNLTSSVTSLSRIVEWMLPSLGTFRFKKKGLLLYKLVSD